MKTINLYLLVAFLEGSTLMSAELISSKVLAPVFGTSLYVWTSVFICTLSGLAIGYFVGGYLSQKNKSDKILLFALAFSTLFFITI